MSYIDSFDHVLVGYFAGLPVFRPLVDIEYPEDGTDDEDFGCTRHQIVIGGGSGEHPGLVLERPGAAMAAFALKANIFEIPEPDRADLLSYITEAPIHQRYGWRPHQTEQFESLCRSPALYRPHEPDHEALSDWLTLGFGEFAYLAMPDLDAEMSKRLRAFQRKSPLHIEYNNILIPPPGFPAYARSGTAFDSRLNLKLKSED